MFSKKICGYDRKYTKEKRILYIEILIFSETKGFVFFSYRRYCFRKNKPTSKQSIPNKDFERVIVCESSCLS